jgi:hypothetical protein
MSEVNLNEIKLLNRKQVAEAVGRSPDSLMLGFVRVCSLRRYKHYPVLLSSGATRPYRRGLRSVQAHVTCRQRHAVN